jgi:predicted NBD/HSP70 family sugar kinase
MRKDIAMTQMMTKIFLLLLISNVALGQKVIDKDLQKDVISLFDQAQGEIFRLTAIQVYQNIKGKKGGVPSIAKGEEALEYLQTAEFYNASNAYQNLKKFYAGNTIARALKKAKGKKTANGVDIKLDALRVNNIIFELKSEIKKVGSAFWVKDFDSLLPKLKEVVKKTTLDAHAVVRKAQKEEEGKRKKEEDKKQKIEEEANKVDKAIEGVAKLKADFSSVKENALYANDRLLIGGLCAFVLFVILLLYFIMQMRKKLEKLTQEQTSQKRREHLKAVFNDSEEKDRKKTEKNSNHSKDAAKLSAEITALKTQLLNSTQQLEKIENDKNTYRIKDPFYVFPPSENGLFTNKKTEEFDPFETPYKFYIYVTPDENKNDGEFEFVKDRQCYKRFKDFYKLIEPACEAENQPTEDTAHIKTLVRGKIKRERGSWRVTQKAIIKYEEYSND